MIIIDKCHLLVESTVETQKLAQLAAKYVFPGLTILLSGELGTGKTFFASALSRVLGAEAPRSPSFTLVNEYEGEIPIAHVDLYRTEKCTQTELDLLYYQDNGYLILIEWPERLADAGFDNLWKIEMGFAYSKNTDLNELDKRVFSFSCKGSKGCSNMKRFKGILLSREDKNNDSGSWD